MNFKDFICSKRRIIFSLLSFFVASLILAESILAVREANFKVLGEASKTATEAGEATMGAGLVLPAATESVDYYLPYPGILPDHPLYWLKMGRDRLLLWLTKEPTARIERLLLYANKRVGAAEVLIKGGKVNLGLSTASKAEKYLEEAVTVLERLETEDGAKAARIKEELKRATEKHIELLEELLAKVAEEGKAVMQKNLEYAQNVLRRIEAVNQEKKDN